MKRLIVTILLILGTAAPVEIWRSAMAAAIGDLNASAGGDGGFVRGDFYATDPSISTIIHYNSQGALLDPIDVSSQGVDLSGLAQGPAGLAQGPDGLLYVVARRRSSGSMVLAINSRGDIKKRYLSSEPGVNIAFDSSGSFYVRGIDGFMRFVKEREAPVEHVRFSCGPRSSAHVMTALPDGNWLVASARHLCEITKTGEVIREIKSSMVLEDIKDIDYDAVTDSIYVMMGGSSGNFWQLLRLSGRTGGLLEQATMTQGDQIVLTLDGRLVVSSAFFRPRIFSRDLRLLGLFAGEPVNFITQISAGGRSEDVSATPAAPDRRWWNTRVLDPDRNAWLSNPAPPKPPKRGGSAARGFVRGDFYVTDADPLRKSFTIAHYSAKGAPLDPIHVEEKFRYLHGLAQGPDGLLYVVVSGGATGTVAGFAVLAMTSEGVIRKRFLSGELVYGLGSIAFGPSGGFYVGGREGLVRFEAADETSGRFVPVSCGQTSDDAMVLGVVELPNGNLLVAANHHLCEVSKTGRTVREIKPETKLPRFHAIEYDAATGSIYVIMAGEPGQGGELLKIDAKTGKVLGQSAIEGGGYNILLTLDGRLVAGTRIFSKDLRPLEPFARGGRSFVSQIRARTKESGGGSREELPQVSGISKAPGTDDPRARRFVPGDFYGWRWEDFSLQLGWIASRVNS